VTYPSVRGLGVRSRDSGDYCDDGDANGADGDDDDDDDAAAAVDDDDVDE